MANFKRFTLGFTTGGNTPHVAIQRVSDGFFWSDGVGFIANGGNPFLNAMTEEFNGFWQYETDFQVWANGSYRVVVYDGAADTQPVLIGYPQTISGDTQVGFIEASSITTKNAVTSLRGDLKLLQTQAADIAIQLGALSDRIDSMNQVLARRDYRE